MKHINLSSWKGSITDWTELNYIKGGLADEYADIANVKGNYVKKSDNLIVLSDIPETSLRGLTYKVENGKLTVNATNLTGNVTLFLTLKTPITIDPNSRYSSLSGVEINKQMQWYLTSNSSTSSSTYRSTNRFIVNGKSSGNVDLSNSAGNNTYTQVYIYINNDATFDSLTYTPMIIKGSEYPIEFQPGSTTGLYIEDNVNDELIPINDPEVQVDRNTLNLSVAETFDDIPIDDMR